MAWVRLRMAFWISIGLWLIASRYLRRGFRPLLSGWTFKLELWVFLTLIVQRRYPRFDIPAVRKMIEDTPLDLSKLKAVEITDLEIAGLHAWKVDPRSGTSRRFLHFHGGGYIVGNAAGCREFLGGFCPTFDAVALSIDYRLAPEAPFPAAVDDAMACFEALLADGTNAEDIVVGGESAGGGLALALVLRLQAEGKPLPGALFLYSPWVQLRSSRPSYAEHREHDILADEGLAYASELYCAGHDVKDPLCSPIFGEFQNFPPTYLLAGGAEIFIDDIRVLEERMRAAGVRVRLEVEPNMPHTWLYLSLVIPDCPAKVRALGSRVASFIDEGNAPPASP